jgi:hypothetical protein
LIVVDVERNHFLDAPDLTGGACLDHFADIPPRRLKVEGISREAPAVPESVIWKCMAGDEPRCCVILALTNNVALSQINVSEDMLHGRAGKSQPIQPSNQGAYPNTNRKFSML